LRITDSVTEDVREFAVYVMYGIAIGHWDTPVVPHGPRARRPPAPSPIVPPVIAHLGASPLGLAGGLCGVTTCVWSLRKVDSCTAQHAVTRARHD
jgi:hypothetical protein